MYRLVYHDLTLMKHNCVYSSTISQIVGIMCQGAYQRKFAPCALHCFQHPYTYYLDYSLIPRLWRYHSNLRRRKDINCVGASHWYTNNSVHVSNDCCILGKVRLVLEKFHSIKMPKTPTNQARHAMLLLLHSPCSPLRGRWRHCSRSITRYVQHDF